MDLKKINFLSYSNPLKQNSSQVKRFFFMCVKLMAVSVHDNLITKFNEV